MVMEGRFDDSGNGHKEGNDQGHNVCLKMREKCAQLLRGNRNREGIQSGRKRTANDK